MSIFSKDYIAEFSEIPEELTEKSEIVEFFSGCNILVTGGSGFVGRLLIEKLLRCCPGIKKIYVTLREKKGKSLKERLDELFNEPIYEKLGRIDPDFTRKVVLIEWNLFAKDLGLSEESRNLIKDTHAIFHAAANMNFEQTLKSAVTNNVQATKNLLLLGKTMPNLKAFTYVSTAYSNCNRNNSLVDELHYRPAVDPEMAIKLVEHFDDDRLEKLKPIILGECPNAYVFSKSLAENTVLKHSKGITACIVRPAILVATSTDPIRGYASNVYGPIGISIAFGLGFLRAMLCQPEYYANLVPADYSVSNIVAAAWYAHKEREERIKQKVDEDSIPDEKRVRIYNVVSTCQNPITWRTFTSLNAIYGDKLPCTKVVWDYVVILNKSRVINDICHVFLHLIPGAIFDGVLYITGKETFFLAAYRKLKKFSSVVEYYTTKSFQFRNANVLELWDQLKPVDREMFNFNVENLDWNEYFYYFPRGILTYVLKEKEDDFPEGMKRKWRARMAHRTFLVVVSLLTAWLLFIFIRFILGYLLS